MNVTITSDYNPEDDSERLGPNDVSDDTILPTSNSVLMNDIFLAIIAAVIGFVIMIVIIIIIVAFSLKRCKHSK